MQCTLVSNSYSLTCVVFDGYSSGPTIKDVAHERRSKGLKGNQTIFDRNTSFKSKKESFLSNIVNLLTEYLEAIVRQVLYSQNDTNLLFDLSCHQICK